MNILHDISPERITPAYFDAVVEIEKGGKNKYELDKETGLIKLDRILYTSTHYPTNYGFIPLTHWYDNDPLDVFIFCSEPIYPFSIVNCKTIGAVDMIDDDEQDTKIIAVVTNDPQFSSYDSIDDLPPHIMDELTHFLKVYKALEGKETIVKKYHSKDYAMKIIEESREFYNEKYKK